MSDQKIFDVHDMDEQEPGKIYCLCFEDQHIQQMTDNLEAVPMRVGYSRFPLVIRRYGINGVRPLGIVYFCDNCKESRVFPAYARLGTRSELEAEGLLPVETSNRMISQNDTHCNREQEGHHHENDKTKLNPEAPEFISGQKGHDRKVQNRCNETPSHWHGNHNQGQFSDRNSRGTERGNYGSTVNYPNNFQNGPYSNSYRNYAPEFEENNLPYFNAILPSNIPDQWNPKYDSNINYAEIFQQKGFSYADVTLPYNVVNNDAHHHRIKTYHGI